MPTLNNIRHERFAQELAKGKGQTEAYVAAGYKENRSAASRLAEDVNVCERVRELQERGAIRVELTVADIIRELEEARISALTAATPQAGSAVTASLGKAKLLGLIVDKSEAKVTLSQEDALAELE